MLRAALSFAVLGVLGIITAACGQYVSDPEVGVITGVTSVTVLPGFSIIALGGAAQLAAAVTADASTAKTVTWSSSNSAIATVDGTGKVAGAAAGTVTITATSVVDTSKFSVAVVNVLPPPITGIGPPFIAFANVTDAMLNAIHPANVVGQINVTVNAYGGTVDLFLSPGAICNAGTIATSDIKVATQPVPTGSAVTLGVNTAAVRNGPYCMKAQLTSGTTTAVASNPVAITVNNPGTP